jgi:hypothetical protein
MRRMWNDIRAAWPRERRFTWRGWVLLGVLGCLIVVAWRGWDPVRPLLYLLSWFDEDLPIAVATQVLTWAAFGGAAVSFSILSMPAITLALGLSRPRIRWAWYAGLLPLSLFAPSIEFQILSNFARRGVDVFSTGLIELIPALITISCGGLLAVAMRSRFAALWVIVSYLFARTAFWLVWQPWLPRTLEDLLRWEVTYYGLEDLVFVLALAFGLVWIALRSWHVPPEHLCPTCNYDVRGLKSPTCPECGTPITTPVTTKK